MSSQRLIAAILCAAFILTGTYANPARADDAFWHGVRSDVWTDGIVGGVSNWYSQAPPNGAARDVPDGTATFAPGAMRFAVMVTEQTAIEQMLFTIDAPLYTFSLTSGLNILGGGLTNRSNTAPKFTIQEAAVMTLHQTAQLEGQRARAAEITTQGGLLRFLDSSRGGDAEVLNGKNGHTQFRDSSSAEQMKITNEEDGSTAFFDHASGGRARVINAEGGVLTFTRCVGPTGDFKIPIGQIENDGTVILVNRSLRVARSFTQGSDGKLQMSIFSPGSGPADAGSIVTKQNATVDGILEVGASDGVKPGPYKMISAEGTLTGRFAKLQLRGTKKLKGRLAYSGKEVTLILERK